MMINALKKMREENIALDINISNFPKIRKKGSLDYDMLLIYEWECEKKNKNKSQVE